jgi:subtilisin
MSLSRHGVFSAAVLAAASLWPFPPSPAPAASPQLSRVVPAAVAQRARTSGTVRVIVRLDVPFRPEGLLPSPGAIVAQRTAIAATQTAVLGAVLPPDPASVKRFRAAPYLAIEADAALLEQLERLPQVSAVEEDVAHPPLLFESAVLVGGPAASGAGFTGAGQAIAILDTGVDTAHPFLAGRVVAEACFSTTSATSTSLCPDGASMSTAPGSGSSCPLAGCEHGTHVAGIAAGKAEEFSGVAPEAALIAIQVFSRFSDCGGGTPCIRAFTSDVMRGLEHVQGLSGSMPVAAANLSLGSGRFTTPCDGSSLKPVIDNLRSFGVATVIASGNNSYVDALTSPACISTAVSVGSTGDGSNGATVDVVSAFSNRAPFLSLLAPGQWIFSSVPLSGFANSQGTSMAAPHVAGAWAILKSAAPSASVSEILTSLETTGRPVFDPASGLTKPRIQIDAALPQAGPRPAPADFDGDSITDLAVFRPSAGTWDILHSTTGFASRSIHTWGLGDDVPVPGDYDGDGRADLAIFRPSDGLWYILESSTNFNVGIVRQWGRPGDVPIPGGDYDGDGIADLTVFRPSGGLWYVLKSSTNFTAGMVHQWGLPGDVPVPGGDYDGDGIADFAIFRPSGGLWYVLKSSTNFTAGMVRQWGLPGDVPLPGGDYDGDGRADLAIFRPVSGMWFILTSSTNFTVGKAYQWGASGDMPAPGDFDGDGRTDLAVFRPSTGTWHVLQSSTNSWSASSTSEPPPSAAAFRVRASGRAVTGASHGPFLRGSLAVGSPAGQETDPFARFTSVVTL